MEPNPEGLNIFDKDDFAIIRAVASIDPIFEYLLNVLKMIYQFTKGAGYFSKIDDASFVDFVTTGKTNIELLHEPCNKTFLECPSTQKIKEIQYLLAITERASIYNLFLPDKTIMN